MFAYISEHVSWARIYPQIIFQTIKSKFTIKDEFNFRSRLKQDGLLIKGQEISMIKMHERHIYGKRLASSKGLVT